MEQSTIQSDLLHKAVAERAIPYHPKMNKVLGKVTASILLQQIHYWWAASEYQPFYKFKEPCEHEFYREDDSWCEELGFSRREFDTALKTIATKKTSDMTMTDAFKANTPVVYWTNAGRVTYYTINESAYLELMNRAYSKSAKQPLAKGSNVLYQKAERDFIITESTTDEPESTSPPSLDDIPANQKEISYYYRDKTKVTPLGKVREGPWNIVCEHCTGDIIVDHLDDPTECCFCAMCVYTLLSKKPTVDNRHPAIKEYQAKAGSRKLNRTQVDEIIRVVGSDEKRVAFWGKVVKSWLMRHYSPVNIDGMLDWFNQGEIPRTGRRKKKTDFIPDNATREMRDGQEVTIVHVR